MMFQYFVKVVPTVYMKLDGEVSLQEFAHQSPSWCQALESLRLALIPIWYTTSQGSDRVGDLLSLPWAGPGLLDFKAPALSTCSNCVHPFL